ncbi:MAG TPA: hypothetical protein VGH62_11005 [Bradyrhizobium sp.]
MSQPIGFQDRNVINLPQWEIRNASRSPFSFGRLELHGIGEGSSPYDVYFLDRSFAAAAVLRAEQHSGTRFTP